MTDTGNRALCRRLCGIFGYLFGNNLMPVQFVFVFSSLWSTLAELQHQRKYENDGLIAEMTDDGIEVTQSHTETPICEKKQSIRAAVKMLITTVVIYVELFTHKKDGKWLLHLRHQ